jgi:hypothetical protein
MRTAKIAPTTLATRAKCPRRKVICSECICWADGFPGFLDLAFEDTPRFLDLAFEGPLVSLISLCRVAEVSVMRLLVSSRRRLVSSKRRFVSFASSATRLSFSRIRSSIRLNCASPLFDQRLHVRQTNSSETFCRWLPVTPEGVFYPAISGAVAEALAEALEGCRAREVW